MPVGKKELKLLGILGVLLYAFVFYRFVWVPVVPSISDINAKTLSALQEKASLEKDYGNLEAIKSQLTAKNTSNERIDEYLMNSANMVDSLEYVDKLTRLIGSNITQLNIAKPEERFATVASNPMKEDTDLKEDKNNGKRFYEIKMDFKAYMPYGAALDLVKYIEGSTRRVKISKFAVKTLTDSEIKALEEEKAQTAAAAQSGAAVQNKPAGQDKLFEINMTISMYSLNLRASDRMYEYSRHKLNKFLNNGGILFAPAGELQSSTGTAASTGNISDESGEEDIVIKERSYLAAGENLQIFGIDKEDGILRVKTDKPADVVIQLDNGSYSINTADSQKKTLQIVGDLPDKELLTLYIGVDMPIIKENDKIRLNVKITNNSGKKVNISLHDRQKRVAVLDRKGRKIYGGSAVEKVSII